MHSTWFSSQKVFGLQHGDLRTLELPKADEPVGGFEFEWGDASAPMTPAFWAAQSWMWGLEAADHYQLGNTLEEELLACMLGGYGIPAEVGLAAYYRLRDALIADPGIMIRSDAILHLLLEPLTVGNRQVRYRFAKQKANHLSRAFASLSDIERGVDDRTLRDQLMKLPGVGPKTASWTVRNHRRSDHVAILDVHILRVGRSLGFFSEKLTVERHYPILEQSYLRFAEAIGAKASILDSVIWMTARQLAGTKNDSTSKQPDPGATNLQQEFAL